VAIKGLNGFGWLLACAIGAPGCYLVSSQVASERGRVEAVERAIARAHKDIRGLETEFDTRANLAQLERWNGEVMRYSAPTPQQFLSDDRQLAAMREMEGDGMADRYAAMVVPAGVPEIVTGAAKVASDAVAPAPRAETAAATVKGVTVKVVNAEKPETVASAVAKPVRTVAVKAKDRATAALDSKLLRDSSFGDLMQGVRAEAAKVR
jgi:hypothetical protein